MTINTFTTFTVAVPGYIVGETYLFLPLDAAAYVTAGVATTGGTVDVPDPLFGIAAIQSPTLIGTIAKPAGWSVVGTDANISLVLAPKGTGALIAQFPDNAIAGGNARGAGATDWQTSRTVATQVASGLNSHIGGGNKNTASGSTSTISGSAVATNLAMMTRKGSLTVVNVVGAAVAHDLAIGMKPLMESSCLARGFLGISSAICCRMTWTDRQTPTGVCCSGSE